MIENALRIYRALNLGCITFNSRLNSTFLVNSVKSGRFRASVQHLHMDVVDVFQGTLAAANYGVGPIDNRSFPKSDYSKLPWHASRPNTYIVNIAKSADLKRLASLCLILKGYWS
jgi:hypothetical protein